MLQRAVALANGDTITDFAFAPAAERGEIDGGADGTSVSIPVGTSMDEATKRLVRATIDTLRGNKLKAARMLGIPPRTMYRHFSNPEQ